MGFIKLRNAFIKRGFSTKELRSAFIGIKSIILTSNNPNIQKLVINTIINIISIIWILVIIIDTISIISSTFIKREKLVL
jgi:hypothetical protein